MSDVKKGILFKVRFETSDDGVNWVEDPSRDRSFFIQREYHAKNNCSLSRDEFDDVMNALVDSIIDSRYEKLIKADPTSKEYRQVLNNEEPSKSIIGMTGMYRLVSYREVNKMITVEQIQSKFLTPLTQDDIFIYTKRLEIINQVDWVDGDFYAIGYAENSPGTYPLYRCEYDDGIPYLGIEDASGDILDYRPVYQVVTAGSMVVHQK